MAHATVNEIELRPAVPAVVEKTVTLTLTQQEAEQIAAVTGTTHYQSDLADVYRALNGAGIHGMDWRVQNTSGVSVSLRLTRR
jgi:hypothetical protein